MSSTRVSLYREALEQQEQLQRDNRALREAWASVIKIAEGHIRSEYEGTGAMYPMLDELHPAKAVLAGLAGQV